MFEAYGHLRRAYPILSTECPQILFSLVTCKVFAFMTRKLIPVYILKNGGISSFIGIAESI